MSEELIIDDLQFNNQGLIPTIVQDASTKQVLMLAYSSRESLRLCLQTGESWFWSRSRQELWHKGATSGNVQKITSILVDCDADALVLMVIPQGPACHTGSMSCFYRSLFLGKEGETK